MKENISCISSKHMKTDTPTLDPLENIIQDVVLTLIVTISLYFVTYHSHLKEKNIKFLSNIRCKKLSDFQWYKNIFLACVMFREDSNQSFWKEKFIAGLLILLGEKVRKKIKDTLITIVVNIVPVVVLVFLLEQNVPVSERSGVPFFYL